MSNDMPNSVESCVNIIAIAINELGTMHPEIEKIRIGEISDLAEHAEKLYKEEISELRKEIDTLESKLEDWDL